MVRYRLALVLAVLAPTAPAAAAPPQTPFEASNGANWTTDKEEQAFLETVAANSPRVRLTKIGSTAQGRPMNLVVIGNPGPRTAADSRGVPTLLFTCSQHGNEPAGREACLKTIRDLAYGDKPEVNSLLAKATVMFVPAANPDGRAANTRGNSAGTDINRDHITLVTPEARAMAAVIRDYEPDVAIDLHEYGPSEPVLYDDDILYLWSRNLNVDKQVHDMAEDLGRNYIKKGAQAAGYTADEYGQEAVGEQDIQQTAGDHDEGIARNLFGLRHVLGILVETRVDADPLLNPVELVDQPTLNRRRVDSHRTVIDIVLDYLRAKGPQAAEVTAGARERKAKEGADRSAPVYFGGADNVEPTAAQTVAAPCGYKLSAADIAKVGTILNLLGVQRIDDFVPMAQAAEPVIPLVLDGRGARHTVSATPLSTC
jgi:hypothetical protein